MTGFKGTIYTFSSTNFDERSLKSRMDHYRMDYSGLPEFLDVYHGIQAAIAFPLKSYSLKSIADFFGYEYRHPDLDGMSVALEYIVRYQKSKDKNLLKKLLEYNEDDVRSIPWILGKMTSIVGEVETTTEATTVEIVFSCSGCGKQYAQVELIETRFCMVCGTHRRSFKKMTLPKIHGN